MGKRRPDFRQRSSPDLWYDLYKDWELIEASIATQYGIRIRQHTNMPWTEFCILVSGLIHDTPLGAIVAIRAEKDPKMIKQFTPEQRRIYREWRLHRAETQLSNPAQYNDNMKRLEQAFATMFGRKTPSE